MNSKNQGPNQPPELPRSPDEFFKQVAGKGKEQVKEALQKVEEGNEQIRRSVAIVAMLKSEGWKFFWENLETYEDLLGKTVLQSLEGSIMEKGQQVERIQGKMELMTTIDAEVQHHLAKAKEKPVDISELREKFNLEEDKK